MCNSDTLLVLCNGEGLLAGKAVKDPAEQQWPVACLLLHTPHGVQLDMEECNRLMMPLDLDKWS